MQSSEACHKGKDDDGDNGGDGAIVCHFLALPLECNFGGHQLDIVPTLCATRTLFSSSFYSHQWHCILDVAKAVSIGPVDLKRLDPDFACLSFDKMFGLPTWLGALFVRRDSVRWLFHCPQIGAIDDDNKEQEEEQLNVAAIIRHYFSGGSVDSILLTRTEPSRCRRPEHRCCCCWCRG